MRSLGQKVPILKSNISQAAVMVNQEFCEKHPNQCISFICLKCSMYLCEICFPTHFDTHKKNNVNFSIKSYEKVLAGSEQRLQTQIHELEKQIEFIENVQLLATKTKDQSLSKLNWCRQQVLDYVNEYFDKLQEKYLQFIQESENNISQSCSFAVKNLNEMNKEMQSLMEKLHSQNQSKYLLQLVQQDYLNENQLILSRISKQFKELNANLNLIQCNENNLQNIHSAVQNYCKFAQQNGSNKIGGLDNICYTNNIAPPNKAQLRQQRTLLNFT